MFEIGRILTPLLDSVPKTKLDAATAINYATALKVNILGKDKQEKVNSIVVLAKLLDCVGGGDAQTDEFSDILDNSLFNTLFSIVSMNMSTETYKAILKISVTFISGSIFSSNNDSFDKFQPLYESIIEYLDVIDIMTTKLYLQDNKINYNYIRLVTDLINKALKYSYDGIITLAGRLKHVGFFSTIGNLIDTDDKTFLDAVNNLKVAYYNLNEYLSIRTFDMSIKSHQVMLRNLFMFLEISLNEYGTVATTEEYAKAGFTEDPRQFVIDSFTILLAMDLKIFLKDPNMTFKKRFHEELMMSDHTRTFPLNLFMEEITNMWLSIFHQKLKYPNIYNSILDWELMIYHSMNTGLILWQESKADLIDGNDVKRILNLINHSMIQLEVELSDTTKTVEECLDIIGNKNLEQLRTIQIAAIKEEHRDFWKSRFTEFDKVLSTEVLDFVAEQRVIQLLKGSWVYTETHGENLLSSRKEKKPVHNKYFFLTLSPNRQDILYKAYMEKPIINPSFEELEGQSISLSSIHDFRVEKIGDYYGEQEKNKSKGTQQHLISLKGTMSYEKLSFIGDKGQVLFSFYTDTEVNQYVWLDGLKMLKNMIQEGQLSHNTEQQISSLIDIRKNSQFLNLENPLLNVELEPINEDDFYNMSELEEVTKDFYHN